MHARHTPLPPQHRPTQRTPPPSRPSTFRLRPTETPPNTHRASGAGRRPRRSSPSLAVCAFWKKAEGVKSVSQSVYLAKAIIIPAAGRERAHAAGRVGPFGRQQTRPTTRGEIDRGGNDQPGIDSISGASSSACRAACCFVLRCRGQKAAKRRCVVADDHRSPPLPLLALGGPAAARARALAGPPM